MPKKAGKSASSSTPEENSNSNPKVKQAVVHQSPVTECSMGIKISIDAKPGAKQSAVVRIEEGSVVVQIAARAVDGAANSELIEFMAEVLGLRRQNLSLVAGQLSRQKVLLISTPSPLSLSEVTQKLTDSLE